MAKSGSATMKAPVTARKEWGTSAKNMLTEGKRTSGATAQTKLAPPKATDSPASRLDGSTAGSRSVASTNRTIEARGDASALNGSTASSRPALSPASVLNKSGRGGGSAVTRGSAPKVPSAPGRSSAGKNFDQSFAAAKRAGLDQFTWNGKRYTTKVK